MRYVRVLSLIMISIVVLVACNQDEETTEDVTRVVPVEVTEVKVGDMTDVQTLYGRLSPEKAIPLLPEMPGEVDEVEVANGDTVEKDDLIATVRTQAGIVQITAPADGEVLELTIEEDDLISPEESIGLLVDAQTMDITLEVTSAVRALFSQGNTYDAQIEGTDYQAIAAVVSSMPNETGMYEIQLTVDNEDGELITGMVAAVDVNKTELTDVIIVPTEAVIEESDGAYVYVVENGVDTRRVDIHIREMQTGETAVEGELETGEQVIINGQLTVTEDSKVEVVKVVNGS